MKAIDLEKKQLVKEKKIRLSQSLPEAKPDELPYALPENWEWCYLDDLCILITDGTHHTPTYTEAGIPFISVKNVSSGTINFSDTRFISEQEHNELIKRCHPERGDVLLTKVGTTGIAITIDTSQEFSIFVSVALLKLIQGFVNSDYVTRLINSPLVKKYSSDGTEGVGNKNLVLRKIKAFLIPLPPIEEQHRIVAEIDRLMARCDELEKLRTDRNQKRTTVHTAAIDRLLKAQDDRAFSTAWSFITQHFSELYSVKENVTELRKVILQLAVMGKLVPQDPNDEPASELLKAIGLEKQRLVKEGKIKKSKPLPEIKPEEVPYDLPMEWTWVRLGILTQAVEYGTSMKAGDDASKIPVYRMGNIVHGQLIDSNFKYVDREIDDLPKLFLCKNDILFNRTNSYELVGKTAIYLGENDRTTFASYLIRVRLVERHLLPTYFNMIMNSPYFRKTQIEPEVVQQCGQANFNGSKLSATLIPLPPLTEQHRIIAKIDRLMEFCDRLEASIEATKIKQTDLLNAVMSQV